MEPTFSAHQIGRLFLLHWVQLFEIFFLNCNFLSTRDRVACNQTWVSSIHAEHPFALEIVVIGDQLTYLESPFYIIKNLLPGLKLGEFEF